LIGPILSEAFHEARIRDKIRNHPLATDKEAWRRARPFRVAVIPSDPTSTLSPFAGSLGLRNTLI
jgi:hypothetical protein